MRTLYFVNHKPCPENMKMSQILFLGSKTARILYRRDTIQYNPLNSIKSTHFIENPYFKLN